MKKMIRSFFTTALVLAALLVTGSAWAATPVAVWDHDFETLSKGNLTLAVGDDNVLSDDKTTITIGSSNPIRITAANGESATVFSGKAFTMIVDYSDFTYSSAVPLLISHMHQSSGNYGVGISAQGANLVKGIWQQPSSVDLNNGGNQGAPTISGMHRVAMTYSSTGGTLGYLDGVLAYSSATLKGGNLVPYGFAIGGLYSQYGSTGIAQGMKVSRVAIFTSVLNATEVASYKFPTEPVAVWNGFNETTAGTYTANINENQIDSKTGYVTIGESGITLLNSQNASFSGKNSGFTVAIRYSNLQKGSANRIIGTCYLSDTYPDNIGVCINSDGKGYGLANLSGNGTPGVVMPAAGDAFLRFKDDNGTSLSMSDKTSLYANSGLKSSNQTWGKKFSIGASTTGTLPATGMVVKQIAIFDSRLTDTQMASFKFDTMWIGEDGGNWSLAENWEGGVVPQNGDTAIIPAGAVVNVDSAAVTTGVTVQGAGRIIFTNWDKIPTGSWTSSNWTGMLELKNMTKESGCKLNWLGNVESSICFNGFTGYAFSAPNDTNYPLATFKNVEIGEGGLNVTGTFSASYFSSINGNLIGSGTITMSATCSKKECGYEFVGDPSGFTGSVNVSNGSGANMNVGFETERKTNYSLSSNRQIVVGEGVTVGIGVGKTWTADRGIHVYGTVNNAGLLAGSISGSGTVIYEGKLPTTTEANSYKASTWTGTVWLNGYTEYITGFDPDGYGNENSKLTLTGISCWMANNKTYKPEVVLKDGENATALSVKDGSSDNLVTFSKLSGDGTFLTTSDGGSSQKFLVRDGSNFTGSITMQANKGITFGTAATANNNQIVVASGVSIAIAAGKTWSANGGIIVNGTLGGAGTLASATTFEASATIDFSDRAIDADPFVTDNLAINATTSFIFPDNFLPTSEAESSSFRLCSGTLTATDGVYWITVGDKSASAQLTFDTVNKTVSYQWSAAKNEAEISRDIAWSDIQWKAGSFVENAEIELTLTKDASISFTTARTFTRPIRILGGYQATFVCDGVVPTFVMDENWREIIHLKNMNFNDWDFSAYTHNNSPIKFTGVTGFGPKNTTSELTVEAILIDEGETKAITVNNGYSSDAAYTFDKISGKGTFTYSHATSFPTQTYIFKDVSEFEGKFADTHGLKIVLGSGSGTDYTADAITYLADSTVKTNLGWSAPNAVFTDWMKVIGSVDDTLVTVESAPTAFAMVTLLDENGTEKEGLYRLVYEDGAVKIAEASEIIVDIANKRNMGAWTIEDPTELTGVGGVQASSLTLAADAKLILDPIKTPVKLGAAPTFAAGAKLALADTYKDCALGKFTLLTWTGAAIETEGIFDTESVGGACVLTCVDAPENGKKQLVLTVGDYANAPKIKVMPLGDSITEGTGIHEFFARPNYRIPLMKKLAAAGYNVEALGYQKSCNADSASVQANPEYEWHCGMSGQMCRTQGAAGWEDSIDVALDMAGEPDIVTFKIGTNDLRGGVQDPEVLFEAWTNVIWKILKARPATRIICGTVIDARDAGETSYNKNKVAVFNAKIADFIAQGDFPAGRVYLADLNAACPPRDASGNDNGNLADNLHPSWIGHDKMSDCWLAKIKEVVAIPFTPESELVYTTTTAIEDNIPQEYRHGFVKLATYTPTATKKHKSGTALTADDYTDYATDMENTVFSKVGYYVVLKRKNTNLVDYHGHVRYLWVDMEAFGDGKIADFGVPTVKKNQQVVNALHVYSNDTGIRKIEPTDNSAKGFVEFWPFSYNDGGSNIEGAPAHRYGYDWNDTCTGSGSYGSMQVHRIFNEGESWNEGEVLFAYNRWTSKDNNEIGIGSFAQKMSNTTIDYTQTYNLEKVNAAAYDLMTIEIWGKVETTWTGERDNNWNDAGNWSNGVPTEASNVVIPENAEITLNADVNVLALKIQDASVSITGTGSIKVTNLAASTFKGTATIVFDGYLPDDTIKDQLQAETWTGTAWIKNVTEAPSTGWNFNNYGNDKSTVRLTNIAGCLDDNTLTTAVTIDLVDGDNVAAFTQVDNSVSTYVFNKLTGTGTFKANSSSAGNNCCIAIVDVSEFNGAIVSVTKPIVIGANSGTQGSESKITFADGVSVKAGLGWEAASVAFGDTIVIPNAALNQVLVTGLTAPPASIPGVLDIAGNEVENLALKYEAGAGGAPNVVKLVAAGAKTDDGKSYETIEQAINANEDATITIEKDTELNIGELSATAAFKLDQTALGTSKIWWNDIEQTTGEPNSGKYLACNENGVLTVMTGAPANGFTSFESYVLGLKADVATSMPTGDAPADNRKDDKLTVNIIPTPRTIKGVSTIYSVYKGDEKLLPDFSTPSIDLSLPESSEVKYSIKVKIGESQN